MAKTVVGFFDDAEDARRAVEELQENGISQNNIDFSSGGSSTSNTSTTLDADNTSGRKNDGENGITRFFNSLFGTDSDDARKYSSVGSRSNYIVTVHASSDDEAEDAADILDDCGAIDVDERASGYGEGNYDLRSNATSKDYDQNRSKTGDSINRIEEDLEIGKREVETGRVRLRSRIVETPVEEHVRLREEHVNIERNPVDRRVSSNDLANFEEQDIEITERAEVPVVNKEARVVEEIRVNKEVEETDRVVRDSVRKTEVDIDEDRSDRKRDTDSDTNRL